MAAGPDIPLLRLALPKGRMERGILTLLEDAGVRVAATSRSYRPDLSIPDTETKLLKPQNIVEMLTAGSRDAGFTGADWVAELDGRLIEVLDTGLDPVDVVAAAPAALLDGGRLPERRLLVASEYPCLSRRWILERGLNAEPVRSYGATEVFAPEDADIIVDNRSSGATLRANDLVVIGELMRSSTRLYASPAAWADPARRCRIEELALLVRSVLEARSRVMVEANASAACLEQVVAALPCMRQPTVAPLFGDAGFAVRAAVPRALLARVIPAVKAAGASDVVVSSLSQIVP